MQICMYVCVYIYIYTYVYVDIKNNNNNNQFEPPRTGTLNFRTEPNRTDEFSKNKSGTETNGTEPVLS